MNAKIEGWLTAKEGNWLRETARECTGTILEIGSYKGLSTSYLVCGILEGKYARICCVDHFNMGGRDTYKEFLKNMCDINLLPFLTPIKLPSNEARKIWSDNMKIDFLFIDGDHSYDGCKADWDAWTPLVNSGGIIALHDAQGCVGARESNFKWEHNAFPGVHKLADENIRNKADEWGMIDRICWMRKP